MIMNFEWLPNGAISLTESLTWVSCYAFGQQGHENQSEAAVFVSLWLALLVFDMQYAYLT
jgi:hypothetical protein